MDLINIIQYTNLKWILKKNNPLTNRCMKGLAPSRHFSPFDGLQNPEAMGKRRRKTGTWEVIHPTET